MNKILASLDSFTLWLIEHPSTTSNKWDAVFPIWLIDNACVFNGYEGDHTHETRWTADAHKNCKLAVGITIETGGASGGSCWDTGDDGATPYTTDNTLPDINVFLNEIVTYFIDNISHKDYLNIADSVKHGFTGESEYYGNYTEYASVYIVVDDLYKALISKANV